MDGMSVALAVALLALLVALFALVALVAVYARVRGLETAGDAGVTGYPALVGRPAPASVRPGPGAQCGLVAIARRRLHACATVVEALAAVHAAGAVHVVALTDRIAGAGTTPGAGTSASTSRHGPTCSRATHPRCSRSTPPAPSSPGGSSTPTPIWPSCCASSSLAARTPESEVSRA